MMHKMNWRIAILTLSCFSLLTTISAQTNVESDSTGLPGDHFSLEAALAIFKQAESPEDFEKRLNEEGQAANNLDLNEDGEVDYIRVIDNMEDDVHAIVLQVPFSEEEAQDIAVIAIEKTGKDNAVLQIIGDEAIYGEEMIVEPTEETVESPGKGPNADVRITRVVVNVWFWPSVRFVYGPAYRPWVSPWRYRYYPRWYRPWRPIGWRTFRVRTVRHRPFCRVVNTRRVVRAHRVYTPRRTSSVTVTRRTKTVQTRRGTVTRSKTTVRGRNGNVKATKKSRTVERKGRNGNTRTKRKTTRTKRKGRQ